MMSCRMLFCRSPLQPNSDFSNSDAAAAAASYLSDYHNDKLCRNRV